MTDDDIRKVADQFYAMSEVIEQIGDEFSKSAATANEWVAVRQIKEAASLLYSANCRLHHVLSDRGAYDHTA
jgi:hypothetical protein